MESVLEAMSVLGNKGKDHRESHLIVVMLPSMESAFYEGIVRGITDSASNHGFLVVLVRTGEMLLSAADLQNTMERIKARAAILLSPIQPAQDVLVLANKLSIVQCGAIDIADGISCVAIDETAVCKAVTTYLLSQGKRRIAMISGAASLRRMEQRSEGYRQACEAAFLPASRDALMQLQVADAGDVLSVLEQLFNRGEQLDAIFAASDELAIAVAKAVKRIGLSIPNEIGIVGLNNISWREYSDPVLTTVHLPLYRMGFMSAELAVSGVKEPGLSPRRIIVGTEILKRDS
jgi:DNA-binding LacI/PurR family transcriptional regulator